MVRRTRHIFSTSEKLELWERWRRGESHSTIGRALRRDPATIHSQILLHGGITPLPKCRSKRALSRDEREEISRGIAADVSIRTIAKGLSRAPSTVSREISRNGGVVRYRAVSADKRAWKFASRKKSSRLAVNHRLQRIVSTKLSLQWSPEQISGWLRQEFPHDETMHISHETIYRSLFIQARGALKKELVQHLRTRRVMRRSRHSSTKGQTRGQIIDAVSIRDRPAEIEDRAIPGHWEGDLISGSQNSHIATLVERKSRYTILVRVDGKDTRSVVKALTKQILRLPSDLRKTLTWDRGTEMALHKEFSIATNVQVYFCDPQSPWQRGTNENTNRLLRQYFPKKTDLSPYSQSDLNKVALRLNQRPRKTLNFHSPAEAFNDDVALTG